MSRSTAGIPAIAVTLQAHVPGPTDFGGLLNPARRPEKPGSAPLAV